LNQKDKKPTTTNTV